ncbi:MAG: SLC26A/SulP transporter family protein [Bacteroidota bacterium]|nr:SLC26A/SulP transporter family protein [Bacteroidota bacterium]
MINADLRNERKYSLKAFTGDFLSGTAAVLVALPAAIAFSLIIFAPLGAEFSGMAAIGGIMGTIALGLVAPFFGGTKKMISAPSAPPAAVLSVFVLELLKKGTVSPEMIPVYITVVSLLAGLVQMLIGLVGGGKVIKYIPYPVVAGYLSGVAYLIFTGQLPKFLGLSKEIKVYEGILLPNEWRWESICIGGITILTMLLAPKIIKGLPAAIIALVMGIASYFVLSFFHTDLQTLENNPLVIGKLSASISELGNTIGGRWEKLVAFDFSVFIQLLIPAITLAMLLSIDTLKTCVILDVLTSTRHNSNRELLGQGAGNTLSALLCGIPGAGTMGPTLVNINSGAKTKISSTLFGLMALIILLLFGKLIAWIPLAALAGVLMVIAVRMFDKQSLNLLRHKGTIIDFAVILAVVISAISMSLVMAAGVGIAMAIILFLRDQMRASVVLRMLDGTQIFSKKNRPQSVHILLEERGKETIIVELQGQLFFGTTDQLYTKLDQHLSTCKYVILDMKRVQSVDFTAVNMFKQILAQVKSKNGYLIFSSIPLNLPTGLNLTAYFENLGLRFNENLKYFDDIDNALLWAEDEIIRNSDIDIAKDKEPLQLHELELLSGFPDKIIKALASCMEEKHFSKNDKIFSIHDNSDEIYFVRKGNIKIVLPISATKTYHLVTISRGSVFGEMAFIDKVKRSADAISFGETNLFVLSRDRFDKLTIEHPEVAGMFFERLSLLLANRLRQSNKELKSLQDS